MSDSLSLIIPCHNEEGAIRTVLSKLSEVRAKMPQLKEVIVVNDGSVDGSAEILSEFADVIVLNSEKCEGYGAALKKGFLRSTSEFTAFLDMDDTYDVRQLPAMLEQMKTQRLDVLFGNRLGQRNGMPLIRQLGNNLYHHSLRILGFPHIADPCTGMRVFRTSLRERFCVIPQNDLSYSMALTLEIIKSGLKYAEVQVPYYERVGASKLNPLYDGVRFFWAILQYRF